MGEQTALDSFAHLKATRSGSAAALDSRLLTPSHSEIFAQRCRWTTLLRSFTALLLYYRPCIRYTTDLEGFSNFVCFIIMRPLSKRKQEKLFLSLAESLEMISYDCMYYDCNSTFNCRYLIQ